MKKTVNQKAASFRWKRLLLWVKIQEKLADLRPFFLSCGITLAISLLLAGWSVAGYRCRMTTDPPVTESAVFDLREDYLRVRVLDWEFSVKIEVIPPHPQRRLTAL